MAGRGVSAADVSAAIASNNFQAAAGQAKGYFIVSNVSANTDLKNLDQFKQMIVKSRDGGFVRMEDIAKVELAAQSTDASVAFNGEHAIFIGIQATPQGNPLTLVKGVRALFPELERNLPPSMKMKVAYDSTKFIQSSIDEVEKTLGEAVLIVVVVIFLFLASFRSVVIPVVTIPLSLIGVCSLMLAMGFSFNLLTLLAMVLAIGLVFDDAIVVVENIHRHLEEGKTPVQASLQGAREIVGPVISMTITLAAVYAPIGFLGGLTGSLFREFAFTLAGSVIVSGVIALTLSPMMCSVLLKSADEGRFARLVNRVFGAMTRWYGRQLDRSLDYRPITGVFALTILGLVGFLYMNTSKELAPEEDQGIVFSVTKAPKYANIDYVDFYGDKLDKAFAKFPETDLRFVLNGINGPQGGIAGMLIKPWDERQRSSIKVIPQVPRGMRLSPESLGGYYVPTNTGQLVPLSTIVSIETGTDPNSLTHYNQLNSATFQAVPMPGVTVGQAVEFLESEAKKLPAGFGHDYLADSRQYVQEGNQLAITFGFALVIIFLVLAAQFESLRDPLVIMISVPMAIVGALIPLFFGVATINIYTQVGLLTLVGLITKHGILMVEFANELQLKEGLDKRSAIEMAARIRLRPILMTTAAMVTGLIPLLTASGAGAASRFSIGLVVVSGMTIGTMFTLFVLPAVYVWLATDHQAKADSQRTKEIADFDLGRTALKPT